ncbi:BCCT family transporter [Roseomonas tokyonensis]|nr:BCCT family transporter [Falsiroseomonas tokyonensis]MBU8540342.1 BCCT family transporter [Falsiroseomonas tokyonensis]
MRWIFAVIGTMLGVATSLGYGAAEANAGLAHLTGLPAGPWVQVALIAGIIGIALGSVVMGLDAGIRRLSILNLGLALGLMVFVLLTGPTLFLLQAYVQNTGAYLADIVGRAFRLHAYEPSAGSWPGCCWRRSASGWRWGFPRRRVLGCWRWPPALAGWPCPAIPSPPRMPMTMRIRRITWAPSSARPGPRC